MAGGAQVHLPRIALVVHLVLVHTGGVLLCRGEGGSQVKG